MFWGLHCGSQEMLQVPVLVCHGVKAISVALFANRCVYKSKTCENEQGSLERFPQSSPFCYHFLMPNLSAIKSDKFFCETEAQAHFCVAWTFQRGNLEGRREMLSRDPSQPYELALTPTLSECLYPPWEEHCMPDVKKLKALFFFWISWECLHYHVLLFLWTNKTVHHTKLGTRTLTSF